MASHRSTRHRRRAGRVWITVAISSIALLGLITASCADAEFDRAKCRPAWDTYLMLEAELQSGVDYLEYEGLVQTLAREVDMLLQAELSDKERQVAESLQDALLAHQRALEAWRIGTDTGAPVDDTLQSAWLEAASAAAPASALMGVSAQ